MFLHITDARPLHDYVVAVRFDNGESGQADLLPALQGPMFAPLLDQALFKALRVDPELKTIVWPNGADLAPEYVYFLAFRDRPELQRTFANWGYLAESVSH